MSIAELATPFPPTVERLEDDLRERRLRGARALVVDGGCDVRLRGSGRVERERVALLEWLPLSPMELLRSEGSRGEPQSLSRLASLIRPPTVWSLDEAVTAARLLGRERAPGGVPFAWLVEHARGRVGAVHLARVRRRAARIACRMPFAELPCASSAVAAGCVLIEREDAVCASIAATALARYSLSEVVDREAALLHLP